MNQTIASHRLSVAAGTPTARARAPWIASLLAAGLLLGGCGGANEDASLEASSAIGAAGGTTTAEPEPKPTCDRSPTGQRGCVVP